jgi:hypothetical protein
MLEDKRFDVRRIKEMHLIERIETSSRAIAPASKERIKEMHLIERIETRFKYRSSVP